MSDLINEGLEIPDQDGPGSEDPNSDAAFNASVARSVARQRGEAASADPTKAAPESAPTTDPEADSAEAIKRAVASPDNTSTSIEDGLTLPPEQPKGADPAVTALEGKLDQARQVYANVEPQLRAELEELAEFRFLSVLGSDEATDDEKHSAAAAFLREAPTRFEALAEAWDNAEIEALQEYDPEVDLDSVTLPGDQLREVAAQTKSEQRFTALDHAARELGRRIDAEREAIIESRYSDVDPNMSDIIRDSEAEALVALGFDPRGNAEELQRGFLRLDAVNAVVEEENKRRFLQESIASTPDQSISSGLEYPDPATGEYHPRAVKLRFDDPGGAEMDRRIAAKERELSAVSAKKLTPAEVSKALRQQVTAPESTDVMANVKLPSGERYDEHRQKEAREEQARERRAAASRLGLSRERS